ncbi:MAG: PHP domain-containing protein [Candidatus Nanohaloarchaea archaeon]|nr:PHP domain-containing protein [Candidatus Nanohaloarchaea archaeon]
MIEVLHDYHVHSNYSDGELMWKMLNAAERAELEGLGFADHCNVSEREEMARQRQENGMNLDITVERRRKGIESLREEFGVDIHDAVEIDYHPEDEGRIEEFLKEQEFDYIIGSIHYIDGHHVMWEEPYRGKEEERKEQILDRYVEMFEKMVRSGLVDIAAHVDVFARNSELRGHVTQEHYRRLAEALAGSDVTPEINAGRALGGYGEIHPHPDLLEMLRERGVRFTVGTDSHSPQELEQRAEFLNGFVEDRGIEPVTPHS